MTTTQASRYDSPTRNRSSAPVTTMEDFPETLTATQQEAHNVLSHMLARLKDPQSKYHARYGKWIDRHPNLADFCFRCVRFNVWNSLEQRWNYDAMRKIGGDFEYQGRGIYFDALFGLDSLTRLYIGQSSNLRWRLSQHWNFRYRRDNPSLHYHAFQNSKVNTFGVLCALPSPNMGNHMLPGMDSPDLLLNVLEMWMCLVFRCLPEQTLDEWLPADVKKTGGMGPLNIASPVDHGDSEREWIDLSGSGDPLVDEYLSSARKKSQAQYEGTRTTRNEKTEAPAAMDKAAPMLLFIGAAALVGFMLGRAKIR